ncbi:helix-turn-helix domain-containing protein [Paenibacillaceae bacterium WGS1546]|uniref:helix-turn-helix domain-containing protein n=1 Tax=Cohnella sp. WGS1546 TaxID=3366810 RepID=UPI00372D0CC0
MYNLLIVDDELHVVQGLMADLDVAKLEIAKVFKAYNVRQAKEILSRHDIDIVLCDIEMPQGTGLELLEWANSHAPDAQTIFLTSHADFRYVKQALKLGGLDYLLKPVPDEELEQAIEKAKTRLNETYKNNRLERLWSANHPSIVEHFWTELLQQKIASTPAAIQAALEERNVPFSEGMVFLPILISVRRWLKPLSVRDEKIMEYALKKSGSELIAGERTGGPIITVDRGCLLLILPFDSPSVEEGVLEGLFDQCNVYVKSCHRYFYCDLSCYIGNLVAMHEMVPALSQLRAFESNNVVYDNTVFSLTGSSPLPETKAPMPDMSPWAAMLKNGMKDQVVAEIGNYLEERIARSEVHAHMLQQFHQNFLQTVYFVLLAKGRKANELLGDSVSMELSRNALKSVADLKRWVEHCAHMAMSPDPSERHPRDIVENVKRFMAAHLDQSDLSREEIAKHAFLNPDYLARIFKKETGQSMMEYFLQERIGLAKELLLHSEMSVGEIASAVGYSHFSHFSKMFRKLTGRNPNEFRQSHR